ncbi:hypothetical protein ACVLVH_004486 [Kluyvera sp. 1366]
MNKTLLRCAGLALALVSPLVMTSCLPHEKNVAPQAYPAGECQNCSAFSVSVWHVSAGDRGLKDILQPVRYSTPESLSSDNTEVITSPAADAIRQRLEHDKLAVFVANLRGVTASGDSLPLSVDNASGAYSAVLTAGPQTRKLPSRVVNFSLSDSASSPGSRTPGDKSQVNGRVLLRDGDTVVSVHAVRDGWLVWLIGATFSA